MATGQGMARSGARYQFGATAQPAGTLGLRAECPPPRECPPPKRAFPAFAAQRRPRPGSRAAQDRARPSTRLRLTRGIPGQRPNAQSAESRDSWQLGARWHQLGALLKGGELDGEGGASGSNVPDPGPQGESGAFVGRHGMRREARVYLATHLTFVLLVFPAWTTTVALQGTPSTDDTS